jgi:hypothetical protein
MFIVTPVDGICCVWFLYPAMCPVPEMLCGLNKQTNKQTNKKKENS